ncbi:MAG: phenylalanine--tRNA ligase subunit beta [Magnetococcales bacterium]|nr:phenylalanine--tRNA ligase subunit beta [Magnetococcales bacterium]
MKFSLSWLKEHLNTDLSAEQLAEKMVTLGIEVEGLESEGEQFNHVVVGHIETRVKHEDSDKLGVCKVHVGEKEPRQIVCGAPNARDNLTVAVALDGAVLPGDFVIKPTKIRGVKSNGMICSVRELGFGEEHDGIWELETDYEVGTPLATALGLDDVVFDVSLTPNRGDALCVYGIARDLAAAGAGTLIAPKQLPVKTGQKTVDVKLEHEGCTFFTGQMIEGVENGESPAWLKKRLEQAGLRPINTLADVTNYMLMTYGQPMHAYDADKLKGNITVAPAKGGETLEGLDGNTHELAAGDIAIMDDSGVIGLAGIVGGESTSVDENTKRVFLEVAQFNRSNIAVTGQRLQCNTDARYRFERGIDRAMTVPAALLASELMVELCGGTVSGIDTFGTEKAEQTVIEFNPEKVKTFGGLDIDASEVKALLEKLGYAVTGANVMQVTVPTFAQGMENEADLVEEVLRIKGFDAVPTQLPPLPKVRVKGADKGRNADRVARRTLASLGYIECINYSFINRQKAEMFKGDESLLELSNPLDAEEMSTMRPSLIPSLLDAAVKNIARGEKEIRLGEVGKTYTEKSEVLKAAALMAGKAPKHWQGDVQTSLYDIKAHAMAMLESLGLDPEKMQIYTNEQTGFHPGRSGQLALGKNVFTTFGEVHPALMKQYGLKGNAFMFEVNLTLADTMNMKKGNLFMSPYQASERDFAFLVSEDVNAGDIINTLKGVDKDLVRSVNLFDVYNGEGVKEGFKSVALSMTLQAEDRTLKEDEINKVSEKAVAAVQKRFNAEVR